MLISQQLKKKLLLKVRWRGLIQVKVYRFLDFIICPSTVSLVVHCAVVPQCGQHMIDPPHETDDLKEGGRKPSKLGLMGI